MTVNAFSRASRKVNFYLPICLTYTSVVNVLCCNRIVPCITFFCNTLIFFPAMSFLKLHILLFIAYFPSIRYRIGKNSIPKKLENFNFSGEFRKCVLLQIPILDITGLNSTYRNSFVSVKIR